MPKETPTHLLSSILQLRHHFFEIFQSLIVDQIRIFKGVEDFGDQNLANGEVWSELDPHPTYFVKL
jgi:hypothetical protein